MHSNNTEKFRDFTNLITCTCRNFLPDFNFQNYLLITHLHIINILYPYIWSFSLKSSEHSKQRDFFSLYKVFNLKEVLCNSFYFVLVTDNEIIDKPKINT